MARKAGGDAAPDLSHRCAAKLSGPDDKRVVEKPVPARTAERTVVYDNTTPVPTQTTTVYTTR